MSEREEFEKAFPVPDCVEWSDKYNTYVEKRNGTASITDRYNDRWEVWQARSQHGAPVPNLEINADTLRVDTYSTSIGSAWVHKVQPGIRIIHLPTGIETKCESERSQHKNKAIALKELEDKLANYPQHSADLTQLAKSKISQMGGTICGVLVRNEAGTLAAVSDLGRVTWLDGADSGDTQENWKPSIDWAVARCRALSEQGFDLVRLDVLEKNFINAIEAHRPNPPQGEE